MSSCHRIRFPAFILILFIFLFVSAVLIPPGATAARAAAGWEKQVSGTTVPLWGVSAVDKDTAWAVGEGGIILKTINGGQSWDKQTPPSNGSLETEPRVSAVDADIAWAADALGKVIKTANGGSTWASTSAPLLPSPYELFKICDIEATDAKTALAIGYYYTPGENGQEVDYEAILRTTDGGDTWTSQYINTLTIGLFRPGHFLSASISAASPQVIYAQGFRTAVKSTDGGAHWTAVRNEDSNSCELDVSAADAGTSWLTTYANLISDSYNRAVSGNTTLLKSMDAGGTWVPMLDTGDIADVTSPTHDVAWAAGTSATILKTETGGTTWEVQYTDPSHGILHEIAAFDSNNCWAVGEGGAILHTSDGGGTGLPLMHLKSVTPSAGPIGTEIVLEGSNFGTARGSSSVYFSDPINGHFGPAADYSLWSDAEIRCKVPTGFALGQVAVSVYTNMWSKLFLFTINNSVPPTVSAITPARGVSLGPSVNVKVAAKVTGTGFKQGAAIRLVRGSTTINATEVVVSPDTTINCKFNIGGKPLGKYDVYVKNPDSGEGKLTGGFTIVNACGQGAAASVSVFAGLLGLLSVAGLGWRKRRK